MKASLLIAMALALLLCLCPPTQAQPDSMRIVGTTIVGPHECYVVNLWQGDELAESDYFYEVGGYVRHYAYQVPGGSIEMLDEDNYYNMKQAPQVGDTWLAWMMGAPADAEVLSSLMMIVPAGAFQAFVVEYRDAETGEVGFTSYWANSTGVVGMEDNWGFGALTDYDLAGGSGCFPLAVGNWWAYQWTENGVEEGPLSASPSSFLLLQAYPNPFNPLAAISYQLPAGSFVNLEAYDIAGKLISTLANGWQAAGTHRATFDGAVLPSGIYIYRLTAGEFTAAGKMLLLK